MIPKTPPIQKCDICGAPDKHQDQASCDECGAWMCHKCCHIVFTEVDSMDKFKDLCVYCLSELAKEGDGRLVYIQKSKKRRSSMSQYNKCFLNLGLNP